MNILLDECMPRRLTRELKEYPVQTVVDMGWAGTKNGALLRRAEEAGFTIFITLDQNLQYQQNLRSSRLGILIFSANSSRYQDLMRLMPSALKALETLRPGEVRIIN